jgi:hypothetical protein
MQGSALCRLTFSWDSLHKKIALHIHLHSSFFHPSFFTNSMFSDIFGFSYGYNDSGWGPDRSGWRDKSDAATRREADAKRRFDALLQQAKEGESTVFPMTRDVVPPNIIYT